MATKKTKDVVQVLPADLAPVQQDGGSVTAFLSGIVPFFATAGQLEAQANATLERAKTWKQPTSLEEDAALVRDVKAVKEQRKGLGAHWSARSVVYNLHKKLVAAFDRADKPLDEAERIGNNLHNQWVASEKLRVLREADEARRKAEAEARERQEAEAARLAAEAEAAEAASDELSEREQRFVALVAAGRSTSSAAQLAGYANPGLKGVQLAGLTKIVDAIEAAQQAAALRAQAAAVKAQPVAVEEAQPTTEAQIVTEGRSTYAATIVNAEQFVAAALTGKHGIPADCLMPNPVKLNEYARSLHERINLWPGITLKKTTKL